MATVLRETSSPAVADQCFVLDGVSWQSYQAIGRALADRPGLRLTFDQGRLELVTTSPEHEIFKKHLARFVEILAEELDRPFVTAGQMTFQSEHLARGLEADDCFWLEHEPQMRGKLTWDAAVDPPPDLGMEIDISRSALDRMSIYAALRVPEVWCFDGQALTIHRLQPDARYRTVGSSQVFPGVTGTEIAKFLRMARTADVLSVIRAFRQWARQLSS